jgi:hypothetical protein
MTRLSTTPNVFLFTDPAVGHQHGYYDGWVGECFQYTGMGQRGDQAFTAGNRAVLNHVKERRALRLFRGARGNVLYLGEFALDEETAFYRTDAPETDTNVIRQVIVFRRRPVGAVVHDLDDELRVPGGVPPESVERAITSEPSQPDVAEVPVEEHHTERALVNPSGKQREAERREQPLVLAYRAYLEARGSVVIRLKIQPAGEAKPLYSDLYDQTRNNLVEAKGTGTRDTIRMAVGQLADYGRFINPAPARAVLLRERPRADLETLLLSQNLHVIWQDGRTFQDNADGSFV